jgi:hypothetical protein
VDVAAAPVSVRLTVPASTRARISREAVAASPAAGVYLTVENVEAERNSGVVYGVFLSVGDEPPPEGSPGHHIGNVSLFGIEAMNDPDQPHDGDPGLRHTFDVTSVVGSLSRSGEWDPDAVRVTFVPITPVASADESDAPARDAVSASLHEAAAAPVRIGRVSLFVE